MVFLPLLACALIMTLSSAQCVFVGTGNGTTGGIYYTTLEATQLVQATLLTSSGAPFIGNITIQGVAVQSDVGLSSRVWIAVGFLQIGEIPVVQYIPLVFRSTDGLLFVAVDLPIGLFSGQLFDVDYSPTNAVFIIAGCCGRFRLSNQQSGANTLAYSADLGLTWTGVGDSLTTVARSVEFSVQQGKWLASGDNSAGFAGVAVSRDGISWTASTGSNSLGDATNPLLRQAFITFSIRDNLWFAVGPSPNVGMFQNTSIAFSSDGLSWTSINDTALTAFQRGQAIRANRFGTIIACGALNNQRRGVISVDGGRTFEEIQSLRRLSSVCRGVAFASGNMSASSKWFVLAGQARSTVFVADADGRNFSQSLIFDDFVGYALVCVPEPIQSFSSGTTPRNSVSNSVVVSTGVVNVTSSTISGDLSCVGTCLVENNIVTQGVVAVLGNISLAAQVQSTGLLVLDSATSTLRIAVRETSSGRTTVTPLFFGGLNGTFSSITVASFDQSPCVSHSVAPGSVVYGSTSLSIAVDTRNSCSGSGALSAGAVVGISIGCAAAAAVAVFVGVVIAKKIMVARDATANSMLRGESLSQLKSNNPVIVVVHK